VTDPAAGVVRHFNELRRRGRILHDIVCPDEVLPPLPPDTTPINTGTGGFGGSVGTGAGGFGGSGMVGSGGTSGGPDAGIMTGGGGRGGK
jgi:hypothetical protein